MKKKSKAPTGAVCTSTISGGAMKCALAGEHAMHSSSDGKRRGQYATWQLEEDGRVRVITYSGGKKMGEWFEEGAPAPRKPMTLEYEPEDPEADAAAIATLDDDDNQDDDRPGRRDLETCGAPRVGVPEAVAPKPERSAAEPAVKPRAPLTKIGSHEVHPAAALFPMIDDAEYPTFREDIRENGQRKRIVRIKAGSSWLILDGRNRLRAALDLGFEPKFRTFGDDPGDGIDPIRFVISENVARRHLNETQRAFVGAELVPMYEAQAKERQLTGRKHLSSHSSEGGKATEMAARAVNVGTTSVEAAIQVNRDAAPEVIAASKDRGQLKVSAARELSTLPMQKQRAIIEKMGTGEMRAGKVRAHVKQEKKREVVRKINEQQVAPMPLGPFRVIVVDWPWPYENSDQHDGSRGHIPYPPMSINQALAMATEIDKLAHEDGCILGFWTTNAFMPDAVRIVEAWGFSWRTIRTWDKCRDGIGTWCRSRTEHLIIAERGEVEHTLNEVSTLIAEPRREHSRKPDEAMDVFDAHCPGPRLELFAREPRKGWASWGAEMNKFATEAA